MDSEIRREQKRLAAKTFREKHKELIKQQNAEQYLKNKEKRIEYAREYYLENKEHLDNLAKLRYERNQQRLSEKAKEFRKNNPVITKARDKQYYFKKTYGITIEQLAEMWEKQNGLCANSKCLKPLTNEKGGFAVDHCHSTNKIRELLCRGCNTSLGNLNDSIQKLMGLIFYLRKHQ
jgi:Recombination endonuclease VII